MASQVAENDIGGKLEARGRKEIEAQYDKRFIRLKPRSIQRDWGAFHPANDFCNEKASPIV